MSILDNKIVAFSKIIAMLPDKPNATAGLTSEQLKEWFDTASEEIRQEFNDLIDTLYQSTGAANIGFSSAGFTATNAFEAIVEILAVAQAAQAGTIVPGSITEPKLDALVQAKLNPTIGTGTIPTTGWVANTGDYALKYDFAIAGVTANGWVEIAVDKDSLDTASDAELSPTCTEYAGGVTIYAQTAPALAIPVRYIVSVK